MKCKSESKHDDAMTSASGGDRRTIREGKLIPCTVKYINGKWLFTVPGEGTLVVRDSKQARVVAEVLMNPGMELDPADMEQAATRGPSLVRRMSLPETTSGQCDETCAPEDADLPPRLDPDEQWKSPLDPDLQTHVDGMLPRHTGAVGDDRMVREIDRRLADLKDGIAKAASFSHKRVAAGLEEERSTLRKLRGDYVNPMSGALRPFFTEETEKQVKRCRMWLVRAIQTLQAKGGLPKAAARLRRLISRGTTFVYEEEPGWEWHVMPIPHGALRPLGNHDEPQAA